MPELPPLISSPQGNNPDNGPSQSPNDSFGRGVLWGIGLWAGSFFVSLILGPAGWMGSIVGIVGFFVIPIVIKPSQNKRTIKGYLFITIGLPLIIFGLMFGACLIGMNRH